MRRLALAILIPLFAAGSAWAAATAPKPFDTSQPIRITSDQLKTDGHARQLTFVGHVVARQGDVTIYADGLTVFYRKGSREIDRVEAVGDVRVVQNNRVATGQKGIYYRDTGRIVLTGSPAVHQGETFIEGDSITVLLNEQKSIVTGSRGSRVNAVLRPEKKTQGTP